MDPDPPVDFDAKTNPALHSDAEPAMASKTKRIHAGTDSQH